MRKSLDLTADIIDIRDIIERVQVLDAAEIECEDDAEELAMLLAIMEELKGQGGDEQWRGDWYPATLIRDEYFKDYAQELAEDCGMVSADAQWPNNCIDWEQAARELKFDYYSTDINGVTYWYR